MSKLRPDGSMTAWTTYLVILVSVAFCTTYALAAFCLLAAVADPIASPFERLLDLVGYAGGTALALFYRRGIAYSAKQDN